MIRTRNVSEMIEILRDVQAFMYISQGHDKLADRIMSRIDLILSQTEGDYDYDKDNNN